MLNQQKRCRPWLFSFFSENPIGLFGVMSFGCGPWTATCVNSVEKTECWKEAESGFVPCLKTREAGVRHREERGGINDNDIELLFELV